MRGGKNMGLFKSRKDPTKFEYILDYIINQKELQLSIKYKSIEKAIDLLSKTLSLCTLETYRRKNGKIEEIKEELFYKLNIKPNNNEYSYNFWYKCWSKFFWEKEVLILEINHNLHIAEDFKISDDILKERQYYDIRLISENGINLNLKKSFKSHEVIHLKLNNQKTLQYLEDFYNDIGKLLLISNNYYKKNNIVKYILGNPGTQQPLKDAKTGKELSYDEYKEKLIGSLFSDEESVTLLSKQFTLDKIDTDKNVSSEDYNNLRKSWEESVADSFLIPRSIYFGSDSEKNTSESYFLTYAIKPYLSLLEDALNSIVIEKDEYLQGEKIKANINSIKVYNIIDHATALDKLYSDGFSHNDIRKFTDQEQIDEPWANEHRITKNYSEDVSNSTKGGDESE